MFTIIPAVTGSLGIIPMLFYDLNNKKKEQMYAELLERRRLMNDAVESDNKEMLELAVNAQIIGK
jgi:Na+/melibiose symporter-like transporter